MEVKTFIRSLMAIASFIQGVYTSKIFTCGVINGFAAEYNAMNLALNASSTLSNVSIIFKNFSVTNETNLVTQASLFLQQNVITLIEGSHTQTSACALSTVTGIPLIRLHPNNRPFGQCQDALQMSASYKAYSHATLDILNTFQWTKIALIFDETRFHEAGYFHSISQSSKFTVNFIQIPGKLLISKVMEQIAELEPGMILLYTNRENMELLMKQKPCNSKLELRWMIQGQAPLNLTCRQNSVVLGMRLPYFENTVGSKLQTVMESTFDDSKEIVGLAYDTIQVINQGANTEPCSSINGSSISSHDTDAMLNCMRKVNLTGITGSIKFFEDGKRNIVQLDILNLRNNSFVKIGTWNSSKLAVLFEPILRNMDTASTGSGLAGRKLKAVFLLDTPFVMADIKEDGTVSYRGYCIDLINELAKVLHFTYELYPVADGYYGALTENGTWNGMIGELVRQRADIAVASLTVTESREKVVDFMMAYMYYTVDMLIAKEKAKQAVDFLQFMNPFENEVWFCTLAAIVIISISVFVINYYSPYGYKEEDGKGTSEEFNYFNSLWFSVACMLQQGGDNTPRNLSGRILAGCYWFCILIWVSTYTANLAAFFTVKNAEHPIRSLEDIVKTSYRVGVRASSSTAYAIQYSKYETHQKIWQRVERDGTLAESLDQGVQWVREKDKFVYMTDGPLLKHIANQPPCDFKVVEGLPSPKGLSFAFQPNSPFVNEFTLATLRLHENDFLDGLKRKWWDSTSKCPDEEETTLSRQRIGLRSMFGVYMVLIAGMLIAFMTMLAEIYWYKKRIKESILNKLVIRTNLRPTQVTPLPSCEEKGIEA